MSIINYDIDYNLQASKEAFPYQHEAFMAIKDKEYAAIFHEQGLGKTKIAIDLLLYWLSNRDIDTVLVVTKKTLVNNWCEEFKVHTSLTPKVIGNNKQSNFFIFNSPSRILVTNFETIIGEQQRLKLYLRTRNVAIIIDESAKIKNPESKLTQSFFALSTLFKIRLIMSGTPVANRPYDIWAQIFFLDQGVHLGKDFKQFKSECDLSNKISTDADVRDTFENSVGRIYKKIKSFSVRETKNSGIIHLPSKNFSSIFVPFEETQKTMYEKIRTEMEIELLHGSEIVIDESPETIKRLLRLVQVTSNPRLIDDRYTATSAKEAALDTLINDIMNRGEMVIVWSMFTGNIDSFCQRYQHYQAVKITGKMNTDDRIRSINKFKNQEARILFATPQAAKEGLTLTVANNAIFYDRGFNLDDYLQAQDRIHRISQKKDCTIYNIMVEHSIDIWIDRLLKAKQHAAFLAQGDISIQEYKQSADYSFATIINEILTDN